MQMANQEQENKLKDLRLSQDSSHGEYANHIDSLED